MNIIKYVPKGATLKASRAVLKLQKSSPTTLFYAGAAGVVVTAVLSAKATLKTQQILEDDNVQRFQTADQELREHTNQEKVQLAGKIARAYLPTVVVGAATIGALTGSHRILTTRNTSLTAAYAALSDAYDRYQKRVVEEIGEDKEQAIRQDLTKKTFEENGNTVKYKVPGLAQVSPYARFFDELSSSFTKSAEQNLLFLRCQQDYFNNMLRARGHVFLNEVYDALGLERSGAGAVVGWILNEAGDNYIDFGLYNEQSPQVRAFVNGHERAVLLDFNVDGLIYELIDKK